VNHHSRWPIVLLIALLALGAASGIAGVASLRTGLPSVDDIASFRAPASTRLLDSKGRVIADFFMEKRRPVPLESIPIQLRAAVVAVEDKRFYQHWGVDIARLPGIAWGMVRRGGRVMGTSTITQQLARCMFLTPDRTVTRKVKEMLVAVELERQYSKDEILEMYFNQVWFGGSVYGVQAAAERYFGKTVAALNPVECATIGAMLANPSAYSPYRHPERLLVRRNFFLGKMRRLNRISEVQYKEYVKAPLVVLPAGSQSNEAPYFVEEVRRYLADRYGSDFVYRSGAVVHTTLDLDIQRAANQAVFDQVARLEADYRLKPTKAYYDSTAERDSTVGPPRYLQAALVAMDVHTGAVRAMVGGRDFGASEFNRATQAKRQAGSTFKPFVWTAAIDNGMTAADIEADSAVSIAIPGQPVYSPHNYDGKYLGLVSLRRALALSRNLVSVRLIQKLGPELVVRYAHQLGITSTLQPVYSLALGSVEVSLLEMVRAFNTFANGGVRVQPLMVTRVEDSRGTILEQHRFESQPVLRPAVAYVMTSLMQSVVNEGTGNAVRQVGYWGPAAGKTGTTDDYTDIWFIGYTPEITCGVWLGFDQKRTIYRGATGGGGAAPVWGEFAGNIKLDSVKLDSFPVPDSIATAPVCELSGQLARPSCPRVVYEVFIAGTEPREQCRLHK
jgi:penicillin-binding protein 1A